VTIVTSAEGGDLRTSGRSSKEAFRGKEASGLCDLQREDNGTVVEQGRDVLEVGLDELMNV